MRIALIGGHLTPALSVIEELSDDSKLIYIGRKHALEGDKAVSLEYETITKKGIPFYILKTGRIQRRPTRHTIPSLSKIPFGYFQSIKILRNFKPDVVMGFGGYVSFPVILAAKTLKIPIIIHEQTMEAGAANRTASKFATKVCISFESSRKYFPKEKTVLTGNPVRKTILSPELNFKITSPGPIIYITGGSLGSHFINSLVSGCLAKLLDKYTVIHQTGGATEFNDFEKLNILRDGLNKNRDRYIISKYFSTEEIGSILKSASLVVSRAGINSVSELIILKKPSLLIPLPVSQKDEQLKNAHLVEKVGLGEVAMQKELSPEIFLSKLTDMMENINSYKFNSTEKSFPKNAARKIVEAIYEVYQDRN